MEYQGKIMKKGFTLIELLIVVLIIGILAAIAMPQYQLARDKAKFSNMMNITKALKEANERYYLMYQQYTNEVDNLDISVPYNSKTKTSNYTYLSFGWGGCYLMDITYVYCTMQTPWSEYVLYYSKYGERQTCWAHKNDARSDRLCKSMTGKTSPSSTTSTIAIYDF